MRTAIRSDHAGFEMKTMLACFLREHCEDVADVGTHTPDPVDYPDFAEAAGKTGFEGRADRGVLIRGSGIGASVAVNKIHGIRTGLCHHTYSAHQGLEHDDMNVLVLGARVIGPAMAQELVAVYISAKFTNEERHLRRLNKVKALEPRFGT